MVTAHVFPIPLWSLCHLLTLTCEPRTMWWWCQVTSGSRLGGGPVPGDLPRAEIRVDYRSVLRSHQGSQRDGLRSHLPLSPLEQALGTQPALPLGEWAAFSGPLGLPRSPRGLWKQFEKQPLPRSQSNWPVSRPCPCVRWASLASGMSSSDWTTPPDCGLVAPGPVWVPFSLSSTVLRCSEAQSSGERAPSRSSAPLPGTRVPAPRRLGLRLWSPHRLQAGFLIRRLGGFGREPVPPR